MAGKETHSRTSTDEVAIWDLGLDYGEIIGVGKLRENFCFDLKSIFFYGVVQNWPNLHHKCQNGAFPILFCYCCCLALLFEVCSS